MSITIITAIAIITMYSITGTFSILDITIGIANVITSITAIIGVRVKGVRRAQYPLIAM